MSQGFVGALPGMKLTYPSVFNFIICFAVALVWGNNYYWMKVANCRSEKVARRSFVAAAIILIVVFMVPLCFIGGYMGAFYPEQLTLNGGTVAPTGYLRLCGQDLRVSVWLPGGYQRRGGIHLYRLHLRPGRLRCGQPRYLPAPDQPQG